MTHARGSTQAGGLQRKVDRIVCAYKVARNEFVDGVQAILRWGDSGRAGLDALENRGTLSLLCCPPILDPVASIRQGALEALAQLASGDASVAREVSRSGVLDTVVLSLGHGAPGVRSAAFGALAALVATSEECAELVVEAGAMQGVQKELEAGDSTAATSAAILTNELLNASQGVALRILDEALIKDIMQLLRTSGRSHVNLHTAISTALGSAMAHTAEISQVLAGEGAIRIVAGHLQSESPALRTAALECLCQAAKHGGDLAREVAAASDVVRSALVSAGDALQPRVRRSAATLLHEIAKHAEGKADSYGLVGGIGHIVKFAEIEQGSQHSLPGILALGHIATTSLEVATAVVSVAGQCLLESLHSRYPQVRELPCSDAQIKKSLKSLIHNCKSPESLEPLVKEDVPEEILKSVLKEFLAMLHTSMDARMLLVTSGALQRLQHLSPKMGHRCAALGHDINALFPERLVAYYAHPSHCDPAPAREANGSSSKAGVQSGMGQ